MHTLSFGRLRGVARMALADVVFYVLCRGYIGFDCISLRVCVLNCVTNNSPVDGEAVGAHSSTTTNDVEEDDSAEEQSRNVSSENFWKARSTMMTTTIRRLLTFFLLFCFSLVAIAFDSTLP